MEDIKFKVKGKDCIASYNENNNELNLSFCDTSPKDFKKILKSNFIFDSLSINSIDSNIIFRFNVGTCKNEKDLMSHIIKIKDF